MQKTKNYSTIEDNLLAIQQLGILIIIGYLASLITAAFFVVTILINWKILLFFQNANQN